MKKGRRSNDVVEHHSFELIEELGALLKRWDVSSLAHWGRREHIGIPLSQVLDHLQATGFVEGSKRALVPTAKGRTYIRQCSKRVRAAASKISNDVLDQIVEAIR